MVAERWERAAWMFRQEVRLHSGIDPGELYSDMIPCTGHGGCLRSHAAAEALQVFKVLIQSREAVGSGITGVTI